MLNFTRALYELFVKQGIQLAVSLAIMSKKPRKDCISRTADYLYIRLLDGDLFSNALKTCTSLSFDDVYISFISIAEKNGDLKSALTYLLQKLEREAECRKKLIQALVYPLFVVLLSVSASVFIGIYTDTSKPLLLVKYVSGLILICTGIYFVIAKILGENKQFEAFTAIDFLIRNGVELSEAVRCAVQIAGPSGKTGKILESAGMKLLDGMDLQDAFVSSDYRLREIFYYADMGGSRDDLFGRIAAYLKSQKEKTSAVCLALIEPLFIAVTGGFILILLMTFFMPFINGTGWI